MKHYRQLKEAGRNDDRHEFAEMVYTDSQWRIYIEEKEAVLGGLQTQGAPQIYKIKKWLRNNYNAEHF